MFILCLDSGGVFFEATACSLLMQATGVEAVWTQDTDNVNIGVVVDENARGKDVEFEVHPTRMRLAIKGKVALEGDFVEKVVPDGSFFGMDAKDGKRMCLITLEKKQMGHKSWESFFEEDQVDTEVTHKVG
jgi:hypothetical protein